MRHLFAQSSHRFADINGIEHLSMRDGQVVYSFIFPSGMKCHRHVQLMDEFVSGEKLTGEIQQQVEMIIYIVEQAF